MFGPDSASDNWKDKKFIYEKFKIENTNRLEKFLNIFKIEGCEMIEMSCEEHDKLSAESQFITHLTGRILGNLDLKKSPIGTNGFELLLQVKDNTYKDSFDLFQGLFKFNINSKKQLLKFRDSLNSIENKLLKSNTNRTLEQLKQSPTVKFDAEVSKMIGISKFNVGSTDYPIHHNIKSAVIMAVNENKNGYTNVAGLLELRTLICKYLLDKKNIEYTPDCIVCSNGAKQSIYQSLLLLCNPGDSVVIFKPYWTSYPDMIKLVGGKVIIIEEISELKNISAKVIIICNPNNPSGYIYSQQEMVQISEYATKMDAFIISDEIYERIDYEKKHLSMAQFYPKTFTINGFSKIYSMMGYRLGYAAVPKEYAAGLIKIQSQITSCPGILSQEAGIAALKLPDQVINDYVDELKKKRDYIADIFNCDKPDGTFYLFVKNINHQKLLTENNIAVMPGSAFGKDDYVRICYSNSWDNLEKFSNL